MVRALVVVTLAGLTLLAVRLVPRRDEADQGPVRIESLGPWPAVLFFASRDCETCRPVRQRLHELTGDIPLREILHQDHPGLFSEARVAVVPLTVVVDGEGSVVAQLPGMPPRRDLRQALRQAAS